jgi:hypothetical protein
VGDRHSFVDVDIRRFEIISNGSKARFAVICSFAQPNKDMLRVTKYRPHKEDLGIALIDILLVDAHGIDPQHIGLAA